MRRRMWQSKQSRSAGSSPKGSCEAVGCGTNGGGEGGPPREAEQRAATMAEVRAANLAEAKQAAVLREGQRRAIIALPGREPIPMLYGPV